MSRVRGIVTDLGAERLLADIENILPSFARHIGLAIPDSVTEFEGRLFPFALMAPGWAHLLDTVLRRSLLELDWFGRFLEVAKAVGILIRSYSLDLQKELEIAGEHAAAEIISVSKHPHFAWWRWGTLLNATKGVYQVLPVLKAKWPQLAGLKKIRQTVLVSNASKAVHDELFAHQLTFVIWHCEWLTMLQQYGLGCYCHREREGLQQIFLTHFLSACMRPRASLIPDLASARAFRNRLRFSFQESPPARSTTSPTTHRLCPVVCARPGDPLYT